MLFLARLLLSLVVAVGSAIAPWAAARLNQWVLAVALVIGLALAVLIVGFSLPLYPWTNLVVLLVALAAGILLGRGLAGRTRTFLVVLLVLSALDILQIVLTSGPGSGLVAHVPTIPPPGQLMGNFFLLLPWGHYNLGIFDISILAAMAQYWRKRGGVWLLALAPGVIGVVLAFAFLLLVYNGALPLLPFLTAGWLCSLALAARMKVPAAQPVGPR